MTQVKELKWKMRKVWQSAPVQLVVVVLIMGLSLYIADVSTDFQVALILFVPNINVSPCLF